MAAGKPERSEAEGGATDPKLAIAEAIAAELGRRLPVGRARRERARELYAVWAYGRDRPGVLAALTTALAEANVNVLDISQTVTSGLFAAVMLVDAAACGVSMRSLRAELERRSAELGAGVAVKSLESGLDSEAP